MNPPTTEISTKPPKRNKTCFRSCLALFAGVGIALILFWSLFFFWIGPSVIGKSIETNGGEFFRDVGSLREKYNGTVMIRNDGLGDDFCFRVGIVTVGRDAPSPAEIAKDIYLLKKQSDFMSEEVLIVTIDGDREDHGVRFIFPGKNGYRAAYKPSFFSAYSRRP